MVAAAVVADKALQAEMRGERDLSDTERAGFLESSFKSMDHPELMKIDEFQPSCWGIELPERLLWEAYVVRQDISHPSGWETGRASEPAFMDLNLHAVREDTHPKVVMWQFDLEKAMNPRGLLIAYEEGQVNPVCSDFDCFLIGSKGVSFEPLPDEQVIRIPLPRLIPSLSPSANSIRSDRSAISP